MSVKPPVKPPVKSGRHKSQRIIAGTAHNVIIENDKIVEDLGPAKKDQALEQEQSNIAKTPNDTEEKPKIGLQLVTEDDVYVVPTSQAEETSDNIIIKPNSISQEQKLDSVSQEQKPKSGINLIPVPLEDLGNISKQEKQDQTEPVQVAVPIKSKVPTPKSRKKPEWEDILSKIPEPDPDRSNPQELSIADTPEPTVPIALIEEPKKSHIPIMGPVKKYPQVPKITVPKVQINIPPKNAVIEPIKLENISNKVGDILVTDTYQKPRKTEVVEPSLQKANENTWTQQPVTTGEKSTKEKRKFMSEELEAELLDERKFEQWMKKQKFRENLEKAALFAEQTKEQFEEKIPQLSDKIENVTGEVKNVETKLGTVDDRLGTVDKTIGTLCTGIDCVKDDVKKFQTSQEALERLVQEKYQTSHEDLEKSHNVLEKLVQERFQELGEKVQSLERPTFTCENCGEQVISPLSSYCPNCGSEIQSWSDEEGEPVRGWTPYWKRLGRSTSQ